MNKCGAKKKSVVKEPPRPVEVDKLSLYLERVINERGVQIKEEFERNQDTARETAEALIEKIFDNDIR